MSEQLTSLETRMGALDSERLQLRKDYDILEEKVDYLESAYLKTCIEIRNVPKVVSETRDCLYGTVETLIKNLSYEKTIQRADIRDVTRLPSKKESKTSSIKVEFCNTLIKHNILTAAKKFNKDRPKQEKLNASHLGLREPETAIYIAEELTSKMKKLFYLSRGFASAENYKFCWTTNGRVYLRKEIGEPYILVKSEAQLCSLKSRICPK